MGNRSRVDASSLSLAAALLLACAGPGGAQLVYRYDGATGKCLASDGTEGLNPIDPEAWHEHRTVAVGECADFRAAERINITYRDFENANLRGADFSGNGCYATTFRRSDLTGAKLVGIAGNGCRFEEVDLTRADLRGARLARAQMEKVTLTHALFDQRTELPFSREQALARGMVEAP
jgi:uncharacterized protein YjbI with pentapeptide repeats